MYVVMFHVVSGGRSIESKDSIAYFFQWGGYAVDLFFILSGFILNWVYLRYAVRINWSAYLKARVARIFPLYYLTLCLCLPVTIYSFAKHGLRYIGEDFPINLGLNVFMLSGIIGGWKHTINVPAWSIGVEVFCYLAVFPILVTLEKFLASKTCAPFVMIVTAIFATLGLIICYGLQPIPFGPWHWDCQYLVRGICGFSTGFALCSISRRSPQWEPGKGAINFVSSLVVVIFLLVAFKCSPSYLVLIALPLVVFFSATDKGVAANLLKTKPCQWLGERSYSIYLWHMLCIGYYTQAIHANLHGFIHIAIVIGLILGIAEISYRFFECPCRVYILRQPRKIGIVVKL